MNNIINFLNMDQRDDDPWKNEFCIIKHNTHYTVLPIAGNIVA